MDRISSYDFTQRFASIRQPVEVGTRFVQGRWDPITIDEALPKMTAGEFHIGWRRLTDPVTVTRYSRNLASFYPVAEMALQPRTGYPANLKDDPFGWAMANIRTMIESAVHHAHSMSEGEFLILSEVARTCAEEDPDWATPPILQFLGEAQQMELRFQASIREVPQASH